MRSFTEIECAIVADAERASIEHQRPPQLSSVKCHWSAATGTSIVKHDVVLRTKGAIGDPPPPSKIWIAIVSETHRAELHAKSEELPVIHP